MAITLELSSPELDNEELKDLTERLCSALRDEAAADVARVTTPTEPGAKGDLPAWGQIAIASIGVISAAVTVIGTYLQRAKSVTLKLDPASGKVLEVSATNMDQAQMNQLLARAFEEGQ